MNYSFGTCLTSEKRKAAAVNIQDLLDASIRHKRQSRSAYLCLSMLYPPSNTYIKYLSYIVHQIHGAAVRNHDLRLFRVLH